MTDTLTYLGEASIGAVIPGVMAPLVAAEADLAAKIQAFIDFKPTIALPMIAQLQIAADIVAGFEACIALGIEPPSIALQITLVADALAALRLQLAVILELFSLMAAAGVDLYAYDGKAGGLGPALALATETLTATR
jgi:hypothetical protein